MRVAYSVANSRLMDIESFKVRINLNCNFSIKGNYSHRMPSDVKFYLLNQLLAKIFNEFSNLWMRMKVEAKTKEDYGSQQYKFRPRAFQIESVIEVDISTLGKSLTNDSFSEWKELLSEEEFTTVVILLYNYVQIFHFSMFHVLLFGTHEIPSSL